MNTSQALNSIQQSLSYLNSEWILVATFFIAFFLDVFIKNSKVVKHVSFAGLLFSFFMLINQHHQFKTTVSLFNNFYQINASIVSLKLLISLAGILSFVPFLFGSNEKQKSEYYYLFPLLIFSANLLCMSNHFLSIFLGLEFLSIISYLYIAFEIKNNQSAESSSKYIVFGAFSSALMLYGISWIYSISGTLYIDGAFLSTLSKAPVDIVALALILFSVGFLFKLSVVPFHYYTPDVYEGSSARTLSFISVVPKIAGFAILFSFIRHFQFDYLGSLLLWPNFPWEKVISVLAIATLFIGNLSALSQKNLKRIFAYSSISHTGFLLFGLLALSNSGFDALVYYIIVYTISNIIVFYLLDYWEQSYGITELSHLVGLGKLKSFSSSLMVVVLVSLIGIPPLAGFTAKFYIFSGVLEQFQLSYSPWLLWALIAGVINTVIALFYYFNIARHLFLKQDDIIIEIKPTENKNKYLLAFLLLLTISILILGVFPKSF